MRKISHFSIALIIAVTLSGCAGMQPVNADFVRGCWSTRGGAAEASNEIALLRLLPDSADGRRLRGSLEKFRNAKLMGRLRLTLEESRLTVHADRADGSVTEPVVLRRIHAPPELKSRIFPLEMIFAYPDSRNWMSMAGDSERLRITIIDNQVQMIEPLFEGWRDGCD